MKRSTRILICLLILSTGVLFWMREQQIAAVHRLDMAKASQEFQTNMQLLSIREQELQNILRENQILGDKYTTLLEQITQMYGTLCQYNQEMYAYPVPQFRLVGSNLVTMSGYYANLEMNFVVNLKGNNYWEILDYDMIQDGKIVFLVKSSEILRDTRQRLTKVILWVFDNESLEDEPILLYEEVTNSDFIRPQETALVISPDGKYLVLGEFGLNWDCCKLFSLQTLKEIDLNHLKQGNARLRPLGFESIGGNLLLEMTEGVDSILVQYNLSSGTHQVLLLENIELYNSFLVDDSLYLIGKNSFDTYLSIYSGWNLSSD